MASPERQCVVLTAPTGVTDQPRELRRRKLGHREVQVGLVTVAEYPGGGETGERQGPLQQARAVQPAASATTVTCRENGRASTRLEHPDCGGC